VAAAAAVATYAETKCVLPMCRELPPPLGGPPPCCQVCPYGLYAEQLSGCAFTVPRK
jgi:homogentisate 1,2-dioxygenase